MADVISDTFGNIWGQIQSQTPTVSGGSGVTGVVVGIIISVAVISVIAAFLWFHFTEKKKWNIKTRVHYENPAINGINIGDPVLTRRVRFKDGRVVYLYKTAIQGYTVSPELLSWSRPREHDVIVTQDKKLFTLIGIHNIDVQRKLLHVDVAYPDVEMDRQDLQSFIDQKKVDDPNERLKIIAKVATRIFVIVGIIVIIVLASKGYIDGKKVDLQRDELNLQVTEKQIQVMESVNIIIQSMGNECFNLTKLNYTIGNS